ncbi:hypothetical protein Q8F55_006316 [Vanrija albida]|uniref:DNA binding protein Ncp1 n=1 Tax=Vanrija albida TaxID=181172 RepID=A0ABR3PWR1_9TREE
MAATSNGARAPPSSTPHTTDPALVTQRDTDHLAAQARNLSIADAGGAGAGKLAPGQHAAGPPSSVGAVEDEDQRPASTFVPVVIPANGTNGHAHANGHAERPNIRDAPSRSYLHRPEIVTSYERPLSEARPTASRNQSTASAKPAAATSPGGAGASPTEGANPTAAVAAGAVVGAGVATAATAAGTRTNSSRKAPRTHSYVMVENPGRQPHVLDTPDVAESHTGSFGDIKQPVPQRPSSAHAGVFRTSSNASQQRPHSVAHTRADSERSYRGTGVPLSPQHSRLPPIEDDPVDAAVHGLVVGQVASQSHQRALQQQLPPGPYNHGHPGNGHRGSSYQGHQLYDDGPVPRPRSAFGARPQPVFVEEDYNPHLGRSNTAMSRATTARAGTLSRGANGGTIGSRRGAFGKGAGFSVGTQPQEVLGRDDIHARAEVSERMLSKDQLARLSRMEKKDAKKLAKLLKEEGRAEARAVAQSIADVGRLARLQKNAIEEERKSQHNLSKWTSREHRARLRFLKEKEKYERIEAELRNAENDFEERRDHAAGLTAQVAERTQEIDDMRAQKAADDREREVKLKALKNPAHA